LQMIRTMLIGMCHDVRRSFTHVIFIDGLSIQPWVIGSIPQKKVLISTEDPHTCDLTHLIFPMYDYAFANDVNAAKTFGTYHLATAFDPLEPRPKYNVAESDVLFIGAIYENRLPFLERCYAACKNLNKKMVIVGPKHYNGDSIIDEVLEDKTVDQSEMACYMANSKICLNVFRNVDTCKLSKNSIFSVPPYDLSPRCFDAFGLGSLLVTDHRDSVVDFFTEEIVFKKGEEAGMLKKFLEDEQLRNELLDKFRKTVVTNHTYLNRSTVLLSIVQKDFQ
jgi:spore maturation protein CgeB